MKFFCKLYAVIGFSLVLTSCLFSVVPNLILFSPAENMVTQKPVVLVKGKVDNAVKLYLNNEEIIFNKDGRFYLKKELENEDGYNYFVLTAEGADGTRSKLVRKVFYKKSIINQVEKPIDLLSEDVTLSIENKHPIIKINTIDDGQIFNQNNIQIQGTIYNSNLLKFNGATVNVTASGDFNFDYLLTKKGDFDLLQFQAYTVDRSKVATVTRKIFLVDQKSNGAMIKISSPDDNYVSESDEVLIIGIVKNIKKLFINKKEVSIEDNGIFKYDLKLFKENKNNEFNIVGIADNKEKINLKRTIFYQVSSDNLNEKIEKSSVVQDDNSRNDIPEIEIVSPQNNFVTYKDNITISGRARFTKELFINSRIVKLDEDGLFRETFKLDTFGKYVLNIYAIGDHGLNKTKLHKLFRIEETVEKTDKEIRDQSLETQLSKLISLNLAGVDIKDVINVLAQKGSLNLVTDKSLQGEVFISLKDVKIIDAIDFVLNSQGFSYSIVDNTIMVGSTDSLNKPTRLETNILRLNNIDPTVLKAIITDYLVSGETIQVQDNFFIYTVDTKKVNKINQIIQKLDSEKVPQIMLEAQIIEITKSMLDNLGVTWPESSGIGLQTSDTDGTFTYTTTFTLSAVIALLETEGKAKIIAKPRIKAIHGQQAEIFIGDRIPYKIVTIGAGGVVAESVNFVDAGINLTVLPEINSHTKEIKIKIVPEVSYINGYSGSNNDIPIVRTRRVNTTVFVKNNNTVLIGGLFNSSDSDSNSKIPLLSRLPIAGALFKSSKETQNQTELVIAITPRIIDDEFKELIPIPINTKRFVN
jgi:type IV pilus assembly protein PilQ